MVVNDIISYEVLWFSMTLSCYFFQFVEPLGPDWAWFTFWAEFQAFPWGAFCIPGIQSANAPFHVEDEFEAKQKELEGIVNPIMMKVYQAEIDVSWI
jgi:hypothetical protein